MKKHLKVELEDKLTREVPSLGFEAVDRVRIADIQFSYKNAPLIHELRKRGLAIKENNWKGLHTSNDSLDRIKTRHYHDLMTPVSALITFESEEGLQRALTASTHNVHILG